MKDHKREYTLNRSIHHITPLSNVFLGNQWCNKESLNHQDHVNLHKLCDLKEGYQDSMNQLYAKVNNDIVLSLSSVDELYAQLRHFFKHHEKLPIHVRKVIGEKWKQIVLFHLNQWPVVTDTTDDHYWKLQRNNVKNRGDAFTLNDLEYMMNQDKHILKDMMLHLHRRFKKYKIGPEVLTYPSTVENRNYMIPLFLRGRASQSNQLAGPKKIHHEISKKTVDGHKTRARGARNLTNGSYIFGSYERKIRGNVQEKYLQRVEKVINNDYGHDIQSYYLHSIQQQLTQTIDKRSILQKKFGSDETYRQKSRTFLGMHKELIELSGSLGDCLKYQLSKEYRFL